MGAQTGLRFEGFYSRSVFSFVIPEMFNSQDKVKKSFRAKRLVERLMKGYALEQPLSDFDKGNPIVNFTTLVDVKDYRDEFWQPYWNVLSSPGLPHFPFSMSYKKKFFRAIDWSAFSPLTQADLTGYHSELRCRLFPYGAVSFHLIETFFFPKGCSSEEIVRLLEQRISCDGKTKTQGQFFNEIRGSILDQVLDRREDTPPTNCKPQNVVLHPAVAHLPDLKTSWNDIAILLARSTVQGHVEKYSPESYPNYGRKDQLIFFSPYTSLLLTPDLQKSNSLQCLRERNANLAELVAIQQQFTTVFKGRYDRVLEDLRSRLGHPRAELMSYFKKRVSRKELLSLKEILELEKSLMKPRWTKWASVLRSWNLEPFQQFEEIRDKLNKVDVNVGSDVRDSFKSLLDTIKIIASIVPKGA